jgi:hypothetical protein
MTSFAFGITSRRTPCQFWMGSIRGDYSETSFRKPYIYADCFEVMHYKLAKFSVTYYAGTANGKSAAGFGPRPNFTELKYPPIKLQYGGCVRAS